MSILELKNITKSFGGIKAVNNVSIGFDEEKIYAFIGPNGAGKTTIFNIISGFIIPDEGSIYLKGINISNLSAWERARLGLGRLFQDVRVFNKMKVIDNVACGFHSQTGENPIYSIINRWRINRQEKLIKEKAMELLEFVELADKAEELAENLSYGQQKLLAIARLLACGSDILLLDEPTAGINPNMIEKILDLIRKLSMKESKTIIIIEHNMNVVIEIADWVYFMDEGQITAFGLPSDVLGDPEVRYAYIGI